MVKPPKAFDVWFVVANTVYKGVPYNVVADWAQQGRLAAGDKIRPAGSTQPWLAVSEHEFLSDYLPRRSAVRREPVAAAVAAPVGAAVSEEAGAEGEIPDAEPVPIRRPREEDDDVDMIPLIDVSLVLLVFFIIIRATGALAPVDVPEMRYAGQLSNDPEAITISIEKLNEDQVYYSVRVGPTAPRSNHDLLGSPEEALRALNELLAQSPRPPEVRVACRKDLPRERVYELRRQLAPLQKKNQINNITATVIEAPEKK